MTIDFCPHPAETMSGHSAVCGLYLHGDTGYAAGDYCIEGCGHLAVAERWVGVTENGMVIVELVCAEHLSEP